MRNPQPATLIVAVLSCIVILVSNTLASAQAPAISSAVCDSQSVTPPPPAPAYYQIKGTTGATNIPAGTMTVTFTVKFQKKVGGMWGTSFQANSMVTPVNGNANYDTGWINFSPAVGEEWRILVDASHVDGMGKSTPMPGIGSTAHTPRP